MQTPQPGVEVSWRCVLGRLLHVQVTCQQFMHRTLPWRQVTPGRVTCLEWMHSFIHSRLWKTRASARRQLLLTSYKITTDSGGGDFPQNLALCLSFFYILPLHLTFRSTYFFKLPFFFQCQILYITSCCPSQFIFLHVSYLIPFYLAKVMYVLYPPFSNAALQHLSPCCQSELFCFLLLHWCFYFPTCINVIRVYITVQPAAPSLCSPGEVAIVVILNPLNSNIYIYLLYSRTSTKPQKPFFSW